MAGVVLPTGGSYTNSGTITGANYGIYSPIDPASITNTNTGSITANYGVLLFGGGSVSNAGAISSTDATAGQGDAIDVTGGAGTVTNSGTISSNNVGVLLQKGGSVTNQGGGTISGVWGVNLTDGGSVTNDAGAMIQTTGAVGVYSNATATATVINQGHITATTDGIALMGGGSVTNDAAATISGGRYAVYIGAGGSLTNAGSITGGTLGAIGFGVTGAFTLTLEGGSSLSGDVIGHSTATNTLILEGTGSTSSVFTNFGTLEVQSNANWTLSGATTFTAAQISGDSATLSLGGGATSAVVSGTGDTFTEADTGESVTLSSSSTTFTLNASGETVTLSGTGDTVTLNGNNNTITVPNSTTTTLTVNGTGNIEIWAPTISGTVANQATTSEAAIKPFSGVTIGDKTSGESDTDTLTITLGGTGGTLTGSGLSGGTGGVYTLTGTASAITTELRALTFTPTAGAPNTKSTTTFALSDVTSVYSTPTVNSATSVIDTDPAVAPTITGAVANQPTTSEASIKPFSGVTVGDTNSGATDALTITVGGTGGTLSGTGLSGGTGGVYTLSGTASAITADLEALSFKPTAGAPNTSSTTTFALSDLSSAYSTATMNTTTSVIDTDPAVASTITGAVANQATTSEASIKPFSGVTIGDTNSGATDTLTITLGGTGGTLSGTGLSGGAGGVYTLSGTASAITSELDALSFTPTAGAPGTSSTTTFSLSDLSSAFSTPTVNSTTSVIDKDSAAPLFGSFVKNFTSAQGQIYALYEGILGRAPDPIGFEDWTAALQGGQSLASIAQAFLGSPEYTAKFGNYTQSSGQAFIDSMYETALHRQPDAGGLQAWENALTTGTSRENIAIDFALSSEAQSDLGPSLNSGVFAPSQTDSDIARLYYGVLNRAPDASGLAYWEGVANGTSLATVAQDFLNSSEYLSANSGLSNSQFLTSLYQDELGRAPDAQGFQSWSSALASGAPRATVALDFAESGEAQQHWAANIEVGMKLV